MERGSEWRRWDRMSTCRAPQRSVRFRIVGWLLGCIGAPPSAIDALGITNYYLLDTYESVIAAKA